MFFQSFQRQTEFQGEIFFFFLVEIRLGLANELLLQAWQPTSHYNIAIAYKTNNPPLLILAPLF